MSDLPFISCVCCTGGRVSRLQEALACFLGQDYKGKKELVILNTCPSQTLIFKHPDVQIHNIARPQSLGAARNLAIGLSNGTHIVTFDDDDLALPHMLSLYGSGFQHGADWVRIIPTFSAEAWEIRGRFNTWINAVAFRKDAWLKTGRYDEWLSVGEDRQFFNRLSQTGGFTLDTTDEKVPWIYSWKNDVYHISGKGDDKPGALSAWDRCALDMTRRIANGEEPSGTILLQPKATHDPTVMVEKWLSAQKKTLTTREPVCIVLLGRYGDIINVLPIAYHIASQYDRPYFMVAREFASLLDGVSYVIPDVVDLRNDQINEALLLAYRKYKRVIVCQIWGTSFTPERHTSAYNRESWRSAGFEHKFDEFDSWYPVFDRRDYTQEQALAQKLLGHTEKPVLLVNLTSSISSPFPHGAIVLEKLRQSLDGQIELVDVSALRFDHIYDLLGCIERAMGVLTIDTALIHLTAATTTPLIALTNPQAWLGSIPRAKVNAAFPYSDAGGAINSAIGLIGPSSSATSPKDAIRHQRRHDAPPRPPERKIFHTLEYHLETSEYARMRKTVAERSWKLLYDTKGVIPRVYGEYKRTAKAIGDPRDLPYLKDVLEYGMAEAGSEDIIMFSNDDNYLHPQLPSMVDYHCSLWDVVCSQRCELVDALIPERGTPQQFAYLGRMHMGRDVFAFTKKWLLEHWEEIPDLILGASDWDLMMACMIRLQWGYKSTRQNLEQTMWPADMQRGYVAHQYHDQRWRQPQHVNTDPSQKHNRALFKNWAEKHLPELKFHSHNTI